MSIGIFLDLPKKSTSLRSRRFWNFVWHCQTVRTPHPSLRRALQSLESFCRFFSSFGPQKSSRDFGGRPILHPCACQKHPFTKTTFRLDGNTISGVPGRSRRCKRNRYPIWCNRLRTINSGAVFFPPMRDINALRLAAVLLSAILVTFPGTHGCPYPLS